MGRSSSRTASSRRSSRRPPSKASSARSRSTTSCTPGSSMMPTPSPSFPTRREARVLDAASAAPTGSTRGVRPWRKGPASPRSATASSPSPRSRCSMSQMLALRAQQPGTEPHLGACPAPGRLATTGTGVLGTLASSWNFISARTPSRRPALEEPLRPPRRHGSRPAGSPGVGVREPPGAPATPGQGARPQAHRPDGPRGPGGRVLVQARPSSLPGIDGDACPGAGQARRRALRRTDRSDLGGRDLGRRALPAREGAPGIRRAEGQDLRGAAGQATRRPARGLGRGEHAVQRPRQLPFGGRHHRYRHASTRCGRSNRR